MSKYLVASLLVVVLLIGLIGGFFVSQYLGNDSNSSKLAPMMNTESGSENQSAYSDQEFLRDMIAHHEDALIMSKRVLSHTSRKEVKDMANVIIDVQTKEIDQMKEWLRIWE